MPIATEIITIGDEILLGQTIDTNSAWLGLELDARGFSVVQITSLRDTPEAIRQSIDQALARAQLIIITGGLGPTSDDRTKETLAEYFQMKMVKNEAVLENIQHLLKGRGVPLNPLNVQQATLPDGCIILNNRSGTAAGMIFRKDAAVIVSLPGVPYEMKTIVQEELFPWLETHLKASRRIFKMVMTTGYPESVLAAKLEPWEIQLPEDFSLAYLPSPGIVKLRISCTCSDQKNAEQQLDHQIQQLIERIPEAVYSTQNESIQETIGRLFVENGKTLVTAESCTGGTIGQMITSVPGSSRYYLGGMITYAYDLKKDWLHIAQKDILQHGVVSEPIISQMALEARLKFNADYAVATSGIAGPGGGTQQKPVGLTWIAVSSASGTSTQSFHFGNHRGRNITRASIAALNMLRISLINDFQKMH